MNGSLALWNDSAAKQAILNFVSKVTDSQGEGFVPPSHRIAIFDNDGTLWTESPLYIQGFFAIARLRQLALNNPKLLEKPQYQAALKGDIDFFSANPFTNSLQRKPETPLGAGF